MRRLLTDQRGQTSVEWLVIMVGVVALASVLVVSLPSAGGGIVSEFRQVVCSVGAGGCGGAGAPATAARPGSPGAGQRPVPPPGGPRPAPAPISAGVTPAAFDGPTPMPTPQPTPTPAGPLPAAAAATPQPNPQPGPAPQAPGWRWPASAGTHADQLPTTGDRPYSPPKKARGKPFRTRGGYVDEDGNVWEWAKGGGQHAGPHWDVQHPDGSHTNVAPDGTIIGKDNFPNKRREPQRPPEAEDDSGTNTAESVAIGAGAVGVGGLFWWGAKVLSPACGPLAPVCAVAL